MRKGTLIGILLLAFCMACRFVTPVADFYAGTLYPVISPCLSRLGSFTRFSLEEVIVLGFIIAFVGILVKAVRRKEGLFRWLGRTLVAAMWLFVWFYMGWGNNYYRTGLYQRSGIQRASYSEEMTTSGTLGYLPTRCDVQTALRNPHDTCLRASATDSSRLPDPSSRPGRIWQWQSVFGSIIVGYFK